MTVTICDVGPPDGLQNQPKVLEPDVRADLVNRLADAGLRRIEATSFVNPKLVPQMSGAGEVVEAIDRRDGVTYAGLALNERGYDRLVAAGLDEVHFAFAATETFNRRNQNGGPPQVCCRRTALTSQRGWRQLERAPAGGNQPVVAAPGGEPGREKLQPLSVLPDPHGLEPAWQQSPFQRYRGSVSPTSDASLSSSADPLSAATIQLETPSTPDGAEPDSVPKRRLRVEPLPETLLP